MSLFPLITKTDMEAFKIHYGGQTNQIDANTYINSLLHFTNIVEETNKELSPNSKVQISITAHESGSFVTEIIVLAQTTLDPVVNNPAVQTIGYVKTLIETVGGLYSLAKFLGGKKPKEIQSIDGSTKVTNFGGLVQVFNNNTYHIYNTNPSIRTGISKEMETLSNDPSVQSFDLLDNVSIPIVEIPRADFEEMSNDEGIELAKNERIVVDSSAELSIVTLSFGKKQWEFYYNGNRIPAKIKDESFTERVNKGEAFSKGDRLIAELSIKQEYDENVNDYLNRSYTITKIHSHEARPVKESNASKSAPPQSNSLFKEDDTTGRS